MWIFIRPNEFFLIDRFFAWKYFEQKISFRLYSCYYIVVIRNFLLMSDTISIVGFNYFMFMFWFSCSTQSFFKIFCDRLRQRCPSVRCGSYCYHHLCMFWNSANVFFPRFTWWDVLKATLLDLARWKGSLELLCALWNGPWLEMDTSWNCSRGQVPNHLLNKLLNKICHFLQIFSLYSLSYEWQFVFV